MKYSKFIQGVLLLTSIVFFACSVDHLNNDKPSIKNLSLEQAQLYFENNAQDLKLNEYIYSKATTKSSNKNIIPKWDKAIYSNTSVSEIYMVPILEPNGINALLTETNGKLKKGIATKVEVESHLVIQQNKRTQKIRKFITTTVGISHNKKDNPHHYTGCRKNFEGFMLISDEFGKCFEAFYYKNGKRLKMHIGKANTTPLERKDNIILQYSLGFSFLENSIATKGGGGYVSGEAGDEYCYHCHSLTSFESGVCAICGSSPMEIGGGELYYYCSKCGKLEENCICYKDTFPEDKEMECRFCGSYACDGECSGMGGTGGGGTTTGGNNGNKYVPKPGNKLALPNIPNNIGKQLINSCVTASMEYISQLFGKNINAGIFAVEYGKLYGINPFNIISEGITFNKNFVPFINSFFNTTTFSSYINAIDSGYIIMAAISGGGEYDAHNIIIVGYHQDYSLIYMDPQSGTLKEGNDDIVLGLYKIVITGNK